MAVIDYTAVFQILIHLNSSLIDLIYSLTDVIHVQLLSKIFIDSDFVIIIYIPYTCLRVCCKHMLCLMYDIFLPIHERYI